AKRVPPRVGLALAAFVRTGVQVGPAARTQSLAIGPAQSVGGRREQPLFPKGWAEVEVGLLWIEPIDIGIFGLLIANIGKDEVCFVAHVRGRVGQTTTALERDVPIDSAVPVEPARSGGRETPSNVHGADRLRITLFPHLVVCREIFVNDGGMSFE